MSDAGYLRVKNLEKYQHYKDRCPPWIKLHLSTVRDYDFSCLQDASKAHLLLIWLLASQLDNRIPNDPDWVKGQTGMRTKPNLNLLIDKGFLVLEQDASNTLADCNQSAMPETETEAYTKETETEPPISPKGDGTPAHRIFTCWNSHNALIHHQNLNPRFQKPINARLKDGYSEADLCKAIGEYARLCQSGQAPGHNKWTLAELMSRGQGDWIDKILNGSGAIRPQVSPSVSKSRQAMEATMKNMEDVLGIPETKLIT